MTKTKAKADWATQQGEDDFGQFAILALSKDVAITFRWIEPGTFVMGAHKDEAGYQKSEGPQHEVTITKGFWLADTPCTQAQWLALLPKLPSGRRKIDADRPVTQSRWFHATEYCLALNDRFGQDVIRAGLPSEAQWEYACRAGTVTAFNLGEVISSTQANFDGSKPLRGAEKGPGRKGVTDVRSFPPNAWGLYDMHGNVWEWCADGQREYTNENVRDPLGLLDDDSDRTQRGGSYETEPQYVRSACRGEEIMGFPGKDYSFRLAVGLDEPLIVTAENVKGVPEEKPPLTMEQELEREAIHEVLEQLNITSTPPTTEGPIKEITFNSSPDDMAKWETTLVERFKQTEVSYELRCPHFQSMDRDHDLGYAIRLAKLHHFGVKPTIDLGPVFDKSCELAVEYFTTDWWKNDGGDRDQMTPDPDNDDFRWFPVWYKCILVSAINDDRAAIETLAAWPESWMHHKYGLMDTPEGAEQVYFAMLHRCGYGKQYELDRHVMKGKRLQNLFDAAHAEDDKSLVKALHKTLRGYANKIKYKPVDIEGAIATEETMIAHLWKIATGSDIIPQIKPELRPLILQRVDR